MFFRFSAVAIIAALAFAGAAHAQETPAPPQPAAPAEAGSPTADTATLYAFGRANPDCVQWTDSCQICRRDEKQAVQCSTSGIACLPQAPVCTAPLAGK